MSEQKNRVWIDGCYDLYHFGHTNAVKQASKAVPNALTIVGIHSDTEIELCKVAPVMKYNERIAVISSCRWLDELVLDAPYTTALSILQQHKIDVCVHGEDLTTNERGEDSYHEIKAAGLFKLIKRTPSISTTDIVSRLLGFSKTPSIPLEETSKKLQEQVLDYMEFQTHPKNILEFRVKAAKPGDRIALVVGSFDMYHISHVQLLEYARNHADYVILGIFSDSQIESLKDSPHPYLNLYERSVVVCACKYVDSVLLNIPTQLSPEFLAQFNISIVVKPEAAIDFTNSVYSTIVEKVEKNIVVAPIKNIVTVEEIQDRIIKNRELYEKKFHVSSAKMAQWQSGNSNQPMASL